MSDIIKNKPCYINTSYPSSVFDTLKSINYQAIIKTQLLENLLKIKIEK